MTEDQSSRRMELAATLFLWGLWAGSALPLPVLFIEFGYRQLGACGNEWWHYATLYSHFFLYPVTFGLIATSLLHRPWVLAVRYVCSLGGNTRIRTSGLLVASALAVIVFAGYVEFTRATPAIWSFEPTSNDRDGTAQSEPSGKQTGLLERSRTLLQGRCKSSDGPPREEEARTGVSHASVKACTGGFVPPCDMALNAALSETTKGADAAASVLNACAQVLPRSCKCVLTEALNRDAPDCDGVAATIDDCSEEVGENCKEVVEGLFRVMTPGAGETDSWLRSVVCRVAPSLCASEHKKLTGKEQREFEGLLKRLDEHGAESATQYAYYIGFMANTTLFAVLFATIFIAITFEKGGRAGEEPPIATMRTRLSIALFFATFWMLMRITFLVEKLTIYPEDPLLAMNYLIFLAVVGLYAHLVTKQWKSSARYENHLNIILSVAGVGVGVIGLFEEPLTVRLLPELLIGLFGTESSVLTYMGVLLFLLIVFLPGLLRTWGVDPDTKQEER